MIVNSDFDPSYVIKLKREKFTQQIRKKTLLEVFKRKRIFQHEDEPDAETTQENIKSFHEAMSRCVDEIRAGKNISDNLIKANELFCERQTYVHEQTIALWYPLLDKLMDLCYQDKYYSVVSNLIYQIMFCEADLEKTFKNYENPKLWNMIVEQIEHDNDYLTYENWLFIVINMAYHSPIYSQIIKDNIHKMFSKKRENFNESIVSTAIATFQFYFEQENTISEDQIKFIEDYFLQSFESSTNKQLKLQLFDFFFRISQYAAIEKQYWMDFINKVLSSEMYKDAYQLFETKQSHYLKQQICFLVIYTGFKSSYQEKDINMFLEVLKEYNNESTLDLDVRSVLYWIIAESLNIEKLSQIADTKLMKQMINEIPRENIKCQIEISFLLLKIVQLNKLDLTCFLLKKQGLFNAFFELWNSRYPDIQKNVFESILHLGAQLKYNNIYDSNVHIQFTFLKKSFNDMGLLDQIRQGDYPESIDDKDFNTFIQIYN